MDIKFFKHKETGEFRMIMKATPDPDWIELKANSTDAAVEKHVPVVEVSGQDVKVTVGSVLHPMSEEHYISHIILVTDREALMKNLKPGEESKATFKLAQGEVVKSAYSYCNLHGLWVKEL